MLAPRARRCSSSLTIPGKGDSFESCRYLASDGLTGGSGDPRPEVAVENSGEGGSRTKWLLSDFLSPDEPDDDDAVFATVLDADRSRVGATGLRPTLDLEPVVTEEGESGPLLMLRLPLLLLLVALL
jgi:hypothetical protein